VIAITLASLAACDARPTGEPDILAVSPKNPRASKPTEGPLSPTSADAGSGASAFLFAGSLAIPDVLFAGRGGDHKSESGSDANSQEEPAQPAIGDKRPEPEGDTPEPPMRPTGVNVGDPLVPVLFWTDVTNNKLWRANADGTSKREVPGPTGAATIAAPDGVAIDLVDGFLYWTNMGSPVGGSGTLYRMDLRTEEVEPVIPYGMTATPKQVRIDPRARQLYWCDREGSSVWRANLDGSDAKPILQGHGLMNPVGLGLDVAKRQLYVSDRGARKIYRASFDVPSGETDRTRTDVETLLSFTNGVPLDLDLDLAERKIYWTDFVLGTIQRAAMDPQAEQPPEARLDIEIVAENLDQPIGISLDRIENQLYFTQFGGQVSRVQFDGSQLKHLVSSTGAGSTVLQMASGVTLVRLPR
jgi:sugar lactone lactonase YvrE